ncbi:uncharacterized protein [Euphorbia lathyris]|uniref:uncharacterized protein isoform X2 n=1 Tax=Euphorbia lathyris TaxID=212925 RepID=UPI0033143E3C
MAFDLCFSFSFSPILSFKSSPLFLPFTVPSLSSFSPPSPLASNILKLKFPPITASTQGSQNELTEDSKFVPLNADDPVYGPPALLLLGFELEEAVKIRQLLQEMGGEFLQVIFCTEDMIPGSLWEAMHTSQPKLEQVEIAKSLPRICFLSGLSGEEMMMFIDAFPESDRTTAQLNIGQFDPRLVNPCCC